LVVWLRIVVFGAGAIGSLFGALLAEHGHLVTLVGNRQHMERIEEEGLRVETVSGCGRTVPVATALGGVDWGGVELLLLTTKAYDVVRAARQLRGVLPAGVPVICLQNGVGVEEMVGRELGSNPVLRGVTWQASEFLAPGRIRHTATGKTLVGPPKNHPSHLGFVTRLVKVFSDAGLPTEYVENVERHVWVKTAINAAINPLGAIMGVRNGELLGVEGVESTIDNIVGECVDVAARVGVELDRGAVSRQVVRTIRDTADNKNSMLQDIERGKRTEIDFINGAVCGLGEKFGVPTPLNRLLLQLVKKIEVRGKNRHKKI